MSCEAHLSLSPFVQKMIVPITQSIPRLNFAEIAHSFIILNSFLVNDSIGLIQATIKKKELFFEVLPFIST